MQPQILLSHGCCVTPHGLKSRTLSSVLIKNSIRCNWNLRNIIGWKRNHILLPCMRLDTHASNQLIRFRLNDVKRGFMRQSTKFVDETYFSTSHLWSLGSAEENSLIVTHTWSFNLLFAVCSGVQHVGAVFINEMFYKLQTWIF